MRKIFMILLLSIILCVATGCVENIESSLPTNNGSTVSSTESISDVHTDSSTTSQTSDDSSTPSPTQPTDDVSPTAPTQSTASPTPTQSETPTNSGDDKMDNNCKLIVRGKDMPSGIYVKINYERRDAEIPITAIMKELGAKVEWQDKTKVKIAFGDHDRILDTAQQDFGLPRPPGSTHYFRQVIGNEVIIDSTSATGLIVYWMGAKISIDYDKNFVSIG
jgi:hypothetical protein